MEDIGLKVELRELRDSGNTSNIKIQKTGCEWFLS
jgi:hypothetical protein